MTVNPKRTALALACCVAAAPALAQAQDMQAQDMQAQDMQAQVAPSGGDDLMALDGGELRREIRSRYEAAVALTRDPTIVSADNPRYIWASEAKVACGKAYGYLRSGYQDAEYLYKCECFHSRMTSYMH